MILLTAPFGTCLYSAQLKSPEWEDVETVDIQVELRTMMSGRIKSYRRTQPLHKLRMRIDDLSRGEALRLRDFLVSAAGLDVRLMHHDGSVWRGRITTTADEIDTSGRGRATSGARAEASSYALEFEGSKL